MSPIIIRTGINPIRLIIANIPKPNRISLRIKRQMENGGAGGSGGAGGWIGLQQQPP